MKPVALVTGASSGLGTIFASKLAAEGRNLLLAARRTDKLQALAADLRAKHKLDVFVETADLSASGAVPKLMRSLARQDLEVDCLINCAGFGLRGEFAQLDLARQIEMITLNCSALTELCHAVLPAMMTRRSGSILNVSSTAAFQAGPLMAVYYATKAYVLSFSEALHDELKPYGIHVSCLCPGPTQTEFSSQSGTADTALFKMAGAPEHVVADGLAALRANKAFTVSGLKNKILAQSNRFAPRSISRSISKSLQS